MNLDEGVGKDEVPISQCKRIKEVVHEDFLSRSLLNLARAYDKLRMEYGALLRKAVQLQKAFQQVSKENKTLRDMLSAQNKTESKKEIIH